MCEGRSLVFSEKPAQGLSSGEGEKEKNLAPKKEKEALELPFASERFAKAWGNWKAYKHTEHGFRHKSPLTERGSLAQLKKLSDGKESEAIDIIEQSIANGWEGLFEIKTEDFDRGKHKRDPHSFCVNRPFSKNR